MAPRPSGPSATKAAGPSLSQRRPRSSSACRTRRSRPAAWNRCCPSARFLLPFIGSAPGEFQVSSFRFPPVLASSASPRPGPMSEEKAEKFLELFNKGKEFTEELLRENQRLRYRLAALETEPQGSGATEEVQRLRAEVQQL